MTLSGGAGGANTHVSGEREFSPLSSAHMLCIAPGAALHRVYDKAQVFNLHTGLEQHEGE